MTPHSIRFDLLFDAEEYQRSGGCPWTFFAYPTSMADEHGLPPDTKAYDFIACLQKHAIQVAIWVHPNVANTTYLACRKDESKGCTN